LNEWMKVINPSLGLYVDGDAYEDLDVQGRSWKLFRIHLMSL